MRHYPSKLQSNTDIFWKKGGQRHLVFEKRGIQDPLTPIIGSATSTFTYDARNMQRVHCFESRACVLIPFFLALARKSVKLDEWIYVAFLQIKVDVRA